MDVRPFFRERDEETAMSRIESPATLEPVDRTDEVRPPGGLVEGMHLDQPTFHALYEATPPGVRAELIDGVVYMPSPVRRTHGRQQRASIVWLNHYEENTSGVESLDDATAVLGKWSEPQPDATLRILTEHGGQTRDENDYIVGSPELVLEVARSTRYIDLGPKLKDYDRAGVLEYIVLASKPDEVVWFGREGGSLVERSPGDDGIHRSIVFPGLWLDPAALIRGDTKRLRAVLDLGLATPDPAAFIARLAAAKV
jgi:Uma2 family endonuclease